MINVQIFGDFALVEIVPTIAARVMCGRRTTERYAVRRGSLWYDDATGRRVDAATLRAIEGAI